MIRRQKPHRGAFASSFSSGPLAANAPIPTWLRAAATPSNILVSKGFGPKGKNHGPNGLEEAAFTAGAALSLLDAVVREQEKCAGVWRQRLALSAAAATARKNGRVEDETGLRDAIYLTRPGDDVGPAGSLVLAWQRLATRPTKTLLSDEAVSAAAENFGLAPDDFLLREIAAAARDLSSGEGVAVTAAAKMLDAAARLLPQTERNLGPWLADIVLAQKFNWPVAVPLLGLHVSAAGKGERKLERVSGSWIAEEGRQSGCLAAYSRAAIQALDLSADLSRRAEKLLTVAPKLRAKGSEAVVEKLLGEDAVVASQNIRGISDRGLRRLFDRLVSLGAVRELSGRPTFRIYGI